ncbi:MAG TPA: efflux RND transporter periplasmic adaptor subunit [Steroidobacteraceae bacterium]|nr:efflux RND transporter periplasmic adaptor subunit [Steroidobacteraceae bacterium]
MIKPLLIMAIIAAVVLGGIFAWQAFIGKMMQKGMGAAAAAPQAVSTIAAAEDRWQPQVQATGSVRAVRGADLSPQASGVVDEIAFDSGNDVPAGKILLRLKPNDDYAKLQQLQAAAELAEQTLKRDQEQFAAQAISQAVIDSDVSTLKSANAQVSAQRALIDEKIVKAPFAGRLGIRQVDQGQYLTAGATVVTLQALDPILIDFYVPQQALAQVKIGQAVAALVDTYPGTTFNGIVESTNSKVDSASRNVQVRASFHNADRRLVPGMYASVRIDAGDASNYITLPQTAITYNPYGDTVFVVEQSGFDAGGKPRSIVQQRFVTLGPTRGDQVAVLSGLKVGEIVVTAGQLKLRNGTAVVINNTVTPTNDTNPHPPNE